MEYYLYKMNELMFETADKKFQLIDDSTVPVIVNWKESLSLLRQLEADGPSYSLMKVLSHYSVNLRQYNLKQMVNKGIVEEVIEGVYAAKYGGQYDKDVGLLSDNQWLEENWIV